MICHQHIHGLVPKQSNNWSNVFKEHNLVWVHVKEAGNVWNKVTNSNNNLTYLKSGHIPVKLWIWLSSIPCAGETNKWCLGQTRGSLQYCSIYYSKIDIILNQQFEYWFYNNPYLKKEQIIVSTHNNFDQNKLCILEFYITFTTWHS